MQVATIDNPRNGLPPGYLSWEHYFTESAKYEPTIADRLAVPISEEAAFSFIDYLLNDLTDRENSKFQGDPLRMGWDLKRLFGSPDSAGQSMLSELAAAIGAYSPPPEVPYDSDAYYDRLWATFDRERVDSDRLLLDEMDAALHHGWQAPPEIVDAIEGLRDMVDANRSREHRKEQEALQAAALAEWAALGGFATRQQIDDFDRKYVDLLIWTEFKPVTVVNFPVQQPAPAAPPRYVFETLADLRKLPAAKWLVEKWIPEQGVGIFYGAYAGGKSFILFDLLLHLAYGLKEWHGVKLPDEPRDVLLIAREGAKGFEGRVDAFKAHHGIIDDSNRIVFMRSPANFGDRAQFAELKAAVEKCGRTFKVVAVDTVGRALPGEDFYDPKSITAFMEHLQQLGEIGSGVAIGVHHENKSGDLFGSVYFGASSDFVFLVEREGNPKSDPLRRGQITCVKMKDGEDGWKRRVEYQKAANSLVVASVAEVAGLVGETGPRKKLTPKDQVALQALGEAIKVKGILRAEVPGRTVTIDEWMEQCFKSGAVGPDAAKPRRDLHDRQVNLLAHGMIHVQDGLVRIIERATHGAFTRGASNVPMPPMPIHGQAQS